MVYSTFSCPKLEFIQWVYLFQILQILNQFCEVDSILFTVKVLKKADWIRKLFQLENVKHVREHGYPTLNMLTFSGSINT